MFSHEDLKIASKAGFYSRDALYVLAPGIVFTTLHFLRNIQNGLDGVFVTDKPFQPSVMQQSQFQILYLS
jgi:hypothetical protein